MLKLIYNMIICIYNLTVYTENDYERIRQRERSAASARHYWSVLYLLSFRPHTVEVVSFGILRIKSKY